MKILIINQYSGNKGDRAVAYFELRELLKMPEVEKIYLSTSSPKSWSEEKITHNSKIQVIPWGWNVDGFNPHKRKDWEFRRLMKTIILPYTIRQFNKGKKVPKYILQLIGCKTFVDTLQNVDMVISTGGHHLTTRFTPNVQNELFFDMIVANMYAKELILWSQTFGPFSFTKPLYEQACKRLLESSTVISRDESSVQNIRKISPKVKVKRTYETVMGLNDELNQYTAPSKRDKIVGITVYNAEARLPEEYNAYINTMANITEYLAEKNFKVIFFPHERKDAVIDDRKCIHDIIRLCRKAENITVLDDAPTQDHLTKVASCQLFIGHKTHSIVFALTMATPLIAISYHPKTVDFMNQFGVSENLIDEKNLTFDQMKIKIESILSNLDTIGCQQYTKAAEMGEIVRKDFHSTVLSR